MTCVLEGTSCLARQLVWGGVVHTEQTSLLGLLVAISRHRTQVRERVEVGARSTVSSGRCGWHLDAVQPTIRTCCC
jgi:hypothetical protein